MPITFDGEMSIDLTLDGEFGELQYYSDYKQYPGATTITPNLTDQTLPTDGLIMPSDLVVKAIPSNYGEITYSGSTMNIDTVEYQDVSQVNVTSGGNTESFYDVSDATLNNSNQMVRGIVGYGVGGLKVTGGLPERTSADIIVSGNAVTAPAGFYSSNASVTVQEGQAGTPSAIKGNVSNHSVDVTPSVTNTEGYIEGGTHTGDPVTVTASELVSGSQTITENDTYDVTNLAEVVVEVAGHGELQTKSATYTPTLSQQTDTILPDEGYDGMDEVDITINAVQQGTAGTPSASKGTVSNHSVSVTPSVTNTTGYINGGTKTGTPVTVSASELVSGTKSITQNGTGIDVTNYASVDVDVPVGADVPVFTTTDGWQTFTCNKTFAECEALVSRDPIYDREAVIGALVYAVNGLDEYWSGIQCDTRRSVSGVSLVYSAATDGVCDYEIVYSSNGVIAERQASSLASLSVTQNGTYTPSYGSVYNEVTVNVPSSAPNLQAKTNIAPTTSSQTITADSGYDGLSSVQINAMPSGSATASATKGAVSNHSVTVTPSVTRTAGYVTAGTSSGTAVSVSASELVSGSETKTANGTYDVTNLAEIVVNVSGGGGGGAVKQKQINFIDYDGTILYAYTKAEINAMTSESDLPANPSHTGLTAQGWNWTLAQIKAQLTAVPDGDVWVGQMYITQSGNTEIDVSMPNGRLAPILTICVNGEITVDWGDNTTSDTVTGTSLTTRKAVSHTYASEGNYTISIHVVSGNYTFYNSSSYLLLRKDNITNNSQVYANCIQDMRLGSGITSIGQYAFYYCSSLASITIPDTVTSIGQYAFRYCYSLVSITIPDTVTSIGQYAFGGCYSLANITVPDTVTSIGSSAFSGCYSLANITISGTVTSIGSSAFSSCISLASITIPDTVISIGGNAFQYCYCLASITIPDTVTSIDNGAFTGCNGMAEYHILPTTPPTLGTNVFSNIQSDCVIYVPSAKLNDYKTASNWSTYASYMVGE